MFKNYLTTLIRNITKHKLHFGLTILGLAVGFAASAIIVIINYTEMSYDTHWNDTNRIFQLESTTNFNNDKRKNQYIPAQIYNIIREKIPDVEYISRKKEVETKARLITAEEQDSFQENVSLIDNAFFKIFNYKVEQGTLTDFYADESSIVISNNLSLKLFGRENPIGKIINVETTNFNSIGINADKSNAKLPVFKNYKVVAVIAPTAYKSSIIPSGIWAHLQNEKITLSEKDENSERTYFYSYPMYLKTKPMVDIAQIQKALPALQDNSSLMVLPGGDKPSKTYTISFLNIKDTHLKAAQTKGQIEKIWMLFGLAFIILTMASINYINLELASYSRRQKEIALRKTLGASKKNIIQQFLSESLFVTGLALILSLVLIELCIPWLRDSLNLDIERHYIYDPILIGYLFLMALIVGLIAGIYPSLYLSKFKPATTLKSNKSIESPASIRFRKLLVITQFVISGIMLTCVSVIATQMHKVQQFNPGYQTEKVMFAIHSALGSASVGSIHHLTYELSKITGVQAVAFTMPGLPGKNTNMMQVSRQGDASNKIIPLQQAMLAGPDDLKVLNVKLLAGEYFSAPLHYDEEKLYSEPQRKIYINQQALAPLGFKSAAEAINQNIDVVYSPNYKMPMTIAGVTEAVHIGSLNTIDSPCFFWPLNAIGMPIAIGVRYEQATRSEIAEKIKALWKTNLGYTPYTISIEDSMADEYKNENLIARFIYIFTGIAIFISSLGLYGLATHAASKQKKEIGLRKIHGASIFNIVKLLLWQFSKPILLANIIIWPIALYASSRWLEQFFDRINLWQWGPVFCIASGLLALCIAWLTLGGHAYRVAKTQPVTAIREE